MVPQLSSSATGRFVSELQRRHVVRVAIGYAAVGFVLLQVAEIVLPAFLPSFRADAALRIVVVAFLLLCPVVASLAWVYEITPKGIRSMQALDAESGRSAVAGVLPRLVLLLFTLLVAGTSGLWWYRTDAAALADEQARRVSRLAGLVASPPSSLPAPTDAPRTDTPRPSADPVTPTRARAAPRVSPVASVAVLPLQNFSAPDEGDLSYFTAGMHEALISELGRLGGARVVSRTTTEGYRSEGRSLGEVAQDLGVESVVEASVIRSVGRVRVAVQLVHALTDEHLWTGAFDYDSWDVIAMQRDVSVAVAAAVAPYMAAATPWATRASGRTSPARSEEGATAWASPSRSATTLDRAAERR